MEPKEKAKELYYHFFFKIIDNNLASDTIKQASKQFALICIEEMIKQNGDLNLNSINEEYYRNKNRYLFEVKQEIQNL